MRRTQDGRTWALALGIAFAALPGHAQDALDATQGRGSIQALERVSAGAGWVLTDAALLVTGDAGATWSDVAPTRPTATIAGVHFLDGARGFVAAVDTTERGTHRLTLLATTDGGRSWSEAPVASSELPADRAYSGARVRFLDAQRGFLLGRLASSAAFSRGVLYRTDDGGATWTRLAEPPSAERFVFADGRRGFQLSADAQRVHATFDGGASWSELRLPALGRGEWAAYELPVFTSRLEGLLAAGVQGPHARVATFVTRDGGRTWTAAEAWPRRAGADRVPLLALAAGHVVAAAENGALTLDPAGAARHASLTGLAGEPGVRALSFAGPGHGWALVAEGTCDAAGCREATRVVAFDGAAQEDDAAPATLLTRQEAQPKRGAAPGPDGSTISTAYGFDKCAAATTSEMQAWKTNSPYLDANIYYGGSARACAQPNLTSSWVTTVFNQGWRLIPTWVGPQAPCSGYSNVFSTNTATARTQGLNEGDAAVNAAVALGLGSNTPLYYDLENYTETNTTCTNAVRAFVNAWVEKVKSRGYIAGVYGNGYDAGHDWIPGIIANPPDAVWIANWVCTGGTGCTWTPTVFGLGGLSDSYWANNQRIRQYWGNHNKTYGGATFNIDSDYANGPVATSGGGGGPYTFICDDGQSCMVKYGPSQYWTTATTCGGSPLGYSGDMVWTYVNGTVQSNYARWTPTLSGAGNYTVSVYIPRCNGTSQQAKYRILANGTSSYATVNQNNAYDAWVTLGTYYFASSGTQYVELSDATGEAASTYRQLAFDAVRFVK